MRFPPEWPGEALAFFQGWKEKLESNPDYQILGGTLIERASLTAIGQMSFSEPLHEPGAVELGYGVSPSVEGRGYTTEMARALVSWATEQPGIERITSACLDSNFGSIRVLEKVGFRRIGDRVDDEGRSILWEY